MHYFSVDLKIETFFQLQASKYGAASSIQNCVSPLVLLLQCLRMVTVPDVPLLNVTSGRPYATAEVTILVRKYPENYKKKNSNFKRHFFENG